MTAAAVDLHAIKTASTTLFQAYAQGRRFKTRLSFFMMMAVHVVSSVEESGNSRHISGRSNTVYPVPGTCLRVHVPGIHYNVTVVVLFSR